MAHRLAPYPMSTLGQWQRLSSSIETKSIERLLPPVSNGRRQSDTHFFSAVRGTGAAAKPADVTQYAIDTSFSLIDLIERVDNAVEVIGELQYAFIMLLHEHSLSGLEQWKRLVDVLCRAEHLMCSEAAATSSSARVDITVLRRGLEAVEHQVKEIPEEVLGEELHADFLRVAAESLQRQLGSHLVPMHPALITTATSVVNTILGQIPSAKAAKDTPAAAEGGNGPTVPSSDNADGSGTGRSDPGVSELQQLLMHHFELDDVDDLPVVMDPAEVEGALGACNIEAFGERIA